MKRTRWVVASVALLFAPWMRAQDARPARHEAHHREGADATHRSSARARAPEVTPPPPAAPLQPLGPRDPCREVLRAAQFEDLPGAERAYLDCRQQLVRPGRFMTEREVRTLEEVTEALHALRRPDGAFCVVPAAPFAVASTLDGAQDSRACLRAIDRLLSNEETLTRYLLTDPYAASRLAARTGLDVLAARRALYRATARPEVVDEEVAISRLLGRHLVRTCRCMPGPQPDSESAVRAMRLPPNVEAVLLQGLNDRGEVVTTP